MADFALEDEGDAAPENTSKPNLNDIGSIQEERIINQVEEEKKEEIELAPEEAVLVKQSGP